MELKFKNGIDGTLEDWTNQTTIHDIGKIRRRLESKSAGEAGVIVYDSNNINLRFESGADPVYTNFGGDLSAAQRYIFEVHGIKTDKSTSKLFEGQADFSTIEWPDDEKKISFDVLDKLSALSIINSSVTQRGSELTAWDRIPGGYTMMTALCEIKNYYIEGSGNYVVFTTVANNTGIPHTTPIYQPGETVKIWDVYAQEYKLHLVTDSFLANAPNMSPTWLTTFTKLLPLDVSYQGEYGMITTPKALLYYAKGYYELSDICIYTVESGRNVVTAFDGLKIIEAIIKKAWPGTTIINLTGDTTFPISLDYYETLVDEFPLGQHPLDAIKTLSKSMQCYIFFNKQGSLVIKKKSNISSGTVRTYTPLRKKGGCRKRYMWDKLADAVTVNVTSGKTIDGITLEGTATVTKVSGIKPRNEITFDIIAPPSVEFTEEALNAYALTIAGEIFDFYGKRHYYYNLKTDLLDDMMDWDLLDLIEIDSETYFIISTEIDLVSPTRTANFELVSVAGYDYDYDSTKPVLSKANYQSSGSSSSSSSITNSSNYVIGVVQDYKYEVMPEQYGAIGNGVIDDTTKIQAGLAAALNKKIIFTRQNYRVTDQLLLDLVDGNIELNSGVGVKITSEDTISDSVYFAFWCGRSITYPANDAVYSTDGTNRFKIINADTPRISEYVLAEIISGSVPASTGTLTKISGTGNSTYTYTEKFNGQYYLPISALQFKNGTGIKLSGITLDLSTPTRTFERKVGEFLDGISIENCDGVVLENVYVYGAPQYGIRIKNCRNVTVNSSRGKYNLLGGLCISSSQHVKINGGEYEYNGNHGPENGYGITLMGQDGTSVDGVYLNNEDIEISGIRANYNLRKGIDVHGGIDVHIHDNFITGYIYSAIYAVNEGAGEVGHFCYVKNVNIHDNHIENDSTWFASLTFDGSALPWSHPIQVGSYGDVTGTYGGGDAGTIKIKNNTIKNASVSKSGTNYLKHIISIFGGAMKSLELENNTLEEATCENAVYIGSNSYAQPDMVHLFNNKLFDITATGDLVVGNLGAEIFYSNNKIKNCTANYALRAFEYGAFANFAKVIADNNSIDGTFITGIDVNNGDLVTLNHNKYSGTFTSGKPFNIASDLRFSTSDNIYLVDITPTAGASINLPDFLSKSQGIAKYTLESSSGTPNIINALTVNAGGTAVGGYDGGSLMCDIKIIAGKADQACYSIFTGQAIAGNVGGAEPYTNYTKLNMKQVIGNPVPAQPTLSWLSYAEEGMETFKTLQISLPGAYNSYFISIEFSAWRLIPYQKV